MMAIWKNKSVYILSLFFVAVFAQKVQTKNGTAKLEASVPSFEEVKAVTNTASCVLNLENGEIASLVLIKSFRFKIALMEEHFNENYMESHLFPKAIFRGKVDAWDKTRLSAKPTKFLLKGKMEMHGKSKEIEIEVMISVINGKYTLTSDFELNTDDFGIVIPKIVSNKVSKKVQVNLDFKLE
ncbi:MAG: YceI family protein [Flavobacterium sp.]